MQVQNGPAQNPKSEYPGSYAWQNRMMMPPASNTGSQTMHAGTHNFNPNYNSFTPVQDRVMRW